jgi:hypothetical protein
MERPVLAVDIDGVLSLFGFEEPVEDWPGDMHLIDGIPHCIPPENGRRLQRLGERYELVWASGWEDRANDHLITILGLPEELPYLTFGGTARFGTAHWKLGRIGEYADGRPLAWIDDSIDERCREWAEQRPDPTLLIETESDIGLTDDHVETLIDWAKTF